MAAFTTMTPSWYAHRPILVILPPARRAYGSERRAVPHEVFNMLKAEGKINDVVIENMMNWHHSGFNVYCGKAIWPHNEEGLTSGS